MKREALDLWKVVLFFALLNAVFAMHMWPVAVAQVGSTAPELNTFQNFTESGAFSEDVVFARNAVILAIKFHADAAPTTVENLVAQEVGTAFKFINRNMVGDADYALLPSAPIPMKAGSTLRITYTNTDAAALDIEVVWRYDR